MGDPPGDVTQLAIENVSVTFVVSEGAFRRRKIHAVEGVSLVVRRGEAMGLVGESGSGKTTLARTVVKLNRPNSGRILFEGNDVFAQKKKSNKQYRKHVQIVFQDPYESLNPRFTVERIVEEPLIVHEEFRNRQDRQQKVRELLALVELDSYSVAMKFPHELSGGQRQRVSLARALALGPRLLVADEPVSMLDVSIRVGILNLMIKLKNLLELTYLFITHDLGVARYFCDRIAVMYRGKLVELAQTSSLITEPHHPYTKMLLDSVPEAPSSNRSSSGTPLVELESKLMAEVTVGCIFNPRCPYAQDRCRVEEPELLELEPGHFSACHFPLNKA